MQPEERLTEDDLVEAVTSSLTRLGHEVVAVGSAQRLKLELRADGAELLIASADLAHGSGLDLVRDAMNAGKPVAAICHGLQVLISANTLRGRTVTCWPSIAIDVKNAGGMYVDQPVVENGNLITSRKPDDVPKFSEAIIRALSNSRSSNS